MADAHGKFGRESDPMVKVLKRLKRERQSAHRRRKIGWVVFVIAAGAVLIWLLRSCSA